MKLLSELKDAYGQFADSLGMRRRNIKLPSNLSMEMCGDTLQLQMTAEGVQANMQTDQAAFEAWALVSRLWLGENRVARVVLDWEPGDRQSGHYQRFLYRAAQFRDLFRHWFSLSPSGGGRLRDCRALVSTQPVLNVAANSNGRSVQTQHPEAKLEARLVDSDRFKCHFGLRETDRQFPVGLFAGEVAKPARIFTGGKSAIDIVGVGRDGSFNLFELKAGKNISAGIISELLLYTAVIREAAQVKPRIGFGGAAGDRAKVRPDDVRQCTVIRAVLLAEEFHPLLEHPDLIATLNNAAAVNWNGQAGAKPVSFLMSYVRDFEDAAGATA